jgi:chemotaxis protein MotB
MPCCTYGNWELSTDRANAARRLMMQHGISEGQVTQVRGFADQRLRKKGDPLDPSNRRISLIVQYTERKPTPEEAEGEGKAGEGGEKSGEKKSAEGAAAKPGEGPAAKPAEKPAEKPVAKPGAGSHEKK